MKTRELYEFGPFRLNPAERLLLRDQRIVSLPPKAFDTLLLLVEQSGHLMTKEEMLKRLWPNTFVEEANLAQYISAIRRALGDREGGEPYIETVPKAGYRFVAETRTVATEPVDAMAPTALEETAPASAVSARRFSQVRIGVIAAATAGLSLLVLFFGWHSRVVAVRGSSTGASPSQIQSIAILPLVNLSADAAQEYFSDGLTDELITKVAQIGSLHVISRTSVMGYRHSLKKAPEIGRELHVDSILEGTVERGSDRVRIRIQLIRSATDQHIWAESYDREIKDVLQLESEMAREIAQRIGQLGPALAVESGRIHQVPSEAHEDYLRGRYRWNQRNEAGLRAGIGHFQKAIEMDPLYPQAYAGLADSYLMLANWGFIPAAEGYSKAEAAAHKALELDSQLAEAETSLAYATLLYDWDWAGAESRFRRAIEFNPNYATAHHFYSVYLMTAGRHAEAQREIERARELDPLSLIINSVVGWIYYEGRRYDKAIEQCQRTVEMDPHYAPSLLDLGSVYLARGESEKAIELFRQARAIAGDTATVLSYLAQGYARSRNSTEARKILEQLEGKPNKFVSPWELALIHAALDDKNRALGLLETAADQRASWTVLIGVDPRVDNLRTEPRFRLLLERIRMPLGVPHPIARAALH
jgi:TolB-like protein/DNA-binding winged helix-turn-helix (wHTH) protein/Tfp pilus assembly protein PilF